MSKTAIATGNAPAAIGPYSQGIRAGNLVFTAGQIPLDPATGQVVAGGITEQTTRVFENLKAILEQAGSSLAHAVKATVYLKDMNDFAAMNAVYASYLPQEAASLPGSTGFQTSVARDLPTGPHPPPARSTVEVSRLPKDVLVEIDLIAEV